MKPGSEFSALLSVLAVAFEKPQDSHQDGQKRLPVRVDPPIGYQSWLNAVDGLRRYRGRQRGRWRRRSVAGVVIGGPGVTGVVRQGRRQVVHFKLTEGG